MRRVPSATCMLKVMIFVDGLHPMSLGIAAAGVLTCSHHRKGVGYRSNWDQTVILIEGLCAQHMSVHGYTLTPGVRTQAFSGVRIAICVAGTPRSQIQMPKKTGAFSVWIPTLWPTAESVQRSALAPSIKGNMSKACQPHSVTSPLTKKRSKWNASFYGIIQYVVFRALLWSK